MSEPISADFADVLDLGKMLGRREAFGSVARRGSAAEAECLRAMRDQKQYRAVTGSWDEFCTSHLKMSRSAADRAIRLLDEFGADYFELSQLIRIPPEAYRSIAPAIKDNAVHVDGEAVPLVPENVERVAKAVETLRRANPPLPARSTVKGTLDQWCNRGREVVAALTEIYQSTPTASDYELLASAVDEFHAAIARLRAKMQKG